MSPYCCVNLKNRIGKKCENAGLVLRLVQGSLAQKNELECCNQHVKVNFVEILLLLVN